MSEQQDSQKAKAPLARAGKRRRRSVRALIVVFDLAVVLSVALFFAGYALKGRDLPLPDGVAERAGTALSRGLGGGTLRIADVTVRFDPGEFPEVTLWNARLFTPAGAEIVAIPRVGIALDWAGLFRRQVQPRALSIDGASVRLVRDEHGGFDFGLGAAGGGRASLGSLDKAIAALQQVFELPRLAPVERIEIAALALEYDDLRAGRVWLVENGRLALDNDAASLAISVDATLPDAGAQPAEEPARVALRLSLDKGSQKAELSAQVDGVPAADIAAQAPALSWLAPLDARVSGALIAGTTPDGAMGDLDGTLGIGPGRFQPARSAEPVLFDGARAYFSYRAARGRIDFSELSVSAPQVNLSASGQAFLEGLESGWPEALTGQFQLDEVRLDQPELLPEPTVFDGGAVEFRASLDPFVARIGQLSLSAEAGDGGRATMNAGGRITADDSGWHVALDIGLDRMEGRRLMAHWPFAVAPGTRKWIDGHLRGGDLTNVAAALRFDQGKRPDIAMTFEFSDARVQPLASLPPITDGAGFASTGRQLFSLSLDAGRIRPPDGGIIDISGSDFRIADMSQKPRIAELFWRSRSPVTAALSLLDQPPFGFLGNAGQPVDLAEGSAQLDGRIAFPIRAGIRGRDVDFSVAGRLDAVTSDKAVPGRRIDAETLSLEARSDGLTIAGAARLEDVPLEARFTLPLGADAPPAHVEGTVEIGGRFVGNLGIGLPPGMVTGAGPGRFAIALPDGTAPEFALDSDLRGVGLAVPGLGWSLAAGAQGRLEVAGRLGKTPVVDRLLLDAPGLSLQGAVSVAASGGLDRAVFSRVRLGGWFDGPVTLTGRGAGTPPAVRVDGGSVDIRKASFGGGSGSGGGAAGVPISAALDRLVISKSLELAGVRADLDTGGGLSGDFSGQVNGRAPVSGTLTPGRYGSTVRLRSDRAGEVFKAAGLFGQANGGTMDLVLTPQQGKGEYDGRLKVARVRVKSASTLAALANAISVVGLIDELNGSGIFFDDVEAAFRLTPTFVQVTDASGVGPSLGITMQGVYDMARDRLDMQGVFSPLYVVNSIGAIFTRRGEGLFGVNYRMHGPSKSPSVEVNPLSALTPGMFRDLFRASPTRLRGGG
ncbi:AsmA-like C-terminal region-containing protein [Tropicimonas sp.]|uniref:AsmA-like C-terminal region-containing protein n=1 Tax=Tropicimonas sp. TaxID=2067044 RepID=UPI003A86091E